MHSKAYTTADLIDRTVELLRIAAPRAVATIVLFTAAGTVMDAGALGEETSTASIFAFTALSFIAQYALTRASLHDIGCPLPARTRLGAFIVLVTVSTLAILAGFALLVIPGFLLLVRWWIAVPILIGNDATISESLASSWRETEGHFWPLLLVIVPIYFPSLALLVLQTVTEREGEAGIVQLVAGNFASEVALVFGWHSAVAAYSLSSRARACLVQVFE